MWCQKTAGFSIEVQNPAPQGEKLPIDQDDHRAGEFAVDATTEACGDGRVYQAGIIRMPPTNFTAIDDCVDVDVGQT